MLYCAYGSDTNLNQMAYRCPNARVIGTGMLHGWRLVFKYHADIIPDLKSSVPVLVWDVSEEDIETLDMHAGYPKYYMTRSVTVDMDNGRTLCAFAYVMQPSFNTLEAPVDMYFNCIKDGYIENDMDLNYLYDAQHESFYESVK